MKRFEDKMKLAAPLTIGLLALLGLADSVYLVMLHYGTPPPTAELCSLTGNGCTTVMQTPQASLAGIPTCVIGTIYFAALVGAALLRVFTGRWFAPSLFTGFLAAGAVFSAYLSRVMLTQSVHCPFCVTAHAINLGLVFLFLFSQALGRSSSTDSGVQTSMWPHTLKS